MDENLSLKMLRNLSCPSCNVQYFIKDSPPKRCNSPILLHCGHSVCGFCIQQNLKETNNISCPQCGYLSCLESGEHIIKNFPFNMYLMGNLFVLQNVKFMKDIRFPFIMKSCKNFDYVVKEQSTPHSRPHLIKTCEECSFTALWYCENCKSNYCEMCWTRVHGSAKSLMKHCKTSMSVAETKNSSIKKCPEHETQSLGSCCQDCTSANSLFLQDQEENHFSLGKKNLEINNVKTAAEEAKKICKRMRQTLEKVKLTENSCEIPDKSQTDLEMQVRRNFSRVHGILQLEEDRLLRELHDNWDERKNRVQTLRQQLEDQIKKVEHLLRECEYVEEESQCSYLSDLYTRLKEAENMPCYLISRNSSCGEPKVTFDENLIGLIRTYCTIALPSSEVFQLCSTFDLPEGYGVGPLDVLNVEESPKFEKRTESDVDTLSNSSSRDQEDNHQLEPPQGAVVFQEKKSYAVRVSYIKNPGEFYVTLNSQRFKQMAINKRASQLSDTSSDFPKTVAKDEIYFARYTVDNKWYRARVKTVFPPKKIGDEEEAMIYYIDYGNSETVPISRLRPLPSDLTEHPLAVKCKLFDCVPKHGEWCPESTKTMEKILNNCTATMFTVKVHRDCLEVDLSVVYPEGEIGRDIISVRDALLFLEFSSFVYGHKISRGGTPLKYLEQRLPSVGETFNAIVTHVNSPSDFFVQNVDQDLSYLYRLTNDLQDYYSDNSDKGVVYNPAVGMPCAALFPINQLWYRARIVNVPGKKMVTVFYLDYGNYKTIPWTWIRILKETFLKLPPLALHCELKGIVPINGLWRSQAKSYLKKCLSKKCCQVRVNERPNGKQKLGVFLYRQMKRERICVNAYFVDRGYAFRSGSESLWKFKSDERKDEVEEETPGNFFSKTSDISSDDDDDVEINSEVDSLGWRINRSFQNQNGTKKPQKHNEFENKNCSENFCTENIFQMKVKVLSAESPYSIYVTFHSLMQQFEKLQSELREFYQNSSPGVVDWTEGSVCAVFILSENSWYRASILSILPDDRVKVFLKDAARVTVERTHALRELNPSFNKYPSCSVKCHLAGVEPAGKQWPSVSSEFLLNELQKHKEVYMTKCGQIEKKSLPVELWVHKIFPTGALEPSPKEWITLNRLLVKEGLAVPKRTCALDEESSDGSRGRENKKEVSGLSDEDFTEEKGNELETFRPFPTHWLPPEPVEESLFIGIPTYVDYKACIYIYDVEKDGEKLNGIRDVLLREFENSSLNSGLDEICWSQGQTCIARYHLDNSWYRGLILQLNEDGSYDVLFIDYGNVEKCESHDLREVIKVHDIPILGRKFQLDGIAPLSEDGEWPVRVIDLLHSLIVDKNCKVDVLKPSSNPEEPSIISLEIIDSGTEVGSFLVNEGLALFTSPVDDNSNADAVVVPYHKTPFSIPFSDLNIPCEL